MKNKEANIKNVIQADHRHIRFGRVANVRIMAAFVVISITETTRASELCGVECRRRCGYGSWCGCGWVNRKDAKPQRKRKDSIQLSVAAPRRLTLLTSYSLSRLIFTLAGGPTWIGTFSISMFAASRPYISSVDRLIDFIHRYPVIINDSKVEISLSADAQE